jgi:hypothetical protein
MPTTNDIFEYWRPELRSEWAIPGQRCVHPDDEPYLSKNTFGLELNVPPGHINGRLKTAPIVACFLNPGYEEQEANYFAKPEGRKMLLDQAAGESDFPREKELDRWWSWFKPRVKIEGMGDEELAQNVAILNICAYASKNAGLLSSGFISKLPSATVARAFLHQVLIPEAKEGKRFIVVCRAAWAWGVPRTQQGNNLEIGFPRGGHFGPRVRALVGDWWRGRKHETKHLAGADA